LYRGVEEKHAFPPGRLPPVSTVSIDSPVRKNNCTEDGRGGRMAVVAWLVIAPVSLMIDSVDRTETIVRQSMLLGAGMMLILEQHARRSRD
jgi:hypothetical protein